MQISQFTHISWKSTILMIIPSVFWSNLYWFGLRLGVAAVGVAAVGVADSWARRRY
jgi:hypothetical protein